jgi:hypothetical protein
MGGENMNDDNRAVNTNQGQTNLPDDNTAIAPANSPTLTPYDSDTTSQLPQNNTSNNQNGLPPVVEPPQLAQTTDNSVPAVDDNQLQEIKRSALQNLLPIVGKLDQSPEERFQTLLMVIQASDNRDLINEAYETAAKIPDEGKRAQALLAIINEINFFTQQPPQN